jgi:hypothetical protein
VLIGGFRDFESASAYLKVVKNLPLPELKLAGDKLAYDVMHVSEPVPGKNGQTVMKQTRVNPFSTAIAVRNPTVPAPVKPANKFDPFWKELNANEDYSLLACRKPYTLVVKEYDGSAVVQGGTQSEKGSRFLSMLRMGGDRPGERLSASAAQAHEVAKFLRDRRLGFEAYVLHTRTASIVTVGGFDRLDDPAMQQMQQRLAALRLQTRGGVDPIGLMARPMPMEVPRP